MIPKTIVRVEEEGNFDIINYNGKQLAVLFYCKTGNPHIKTSKDYSGKLHIRSGEFKGDIHFFENGNYRYSIFGYQHTKKIIEGISGLATPSIESKTLGGNEPYAEDSDFRVLRAKIKDFHVPVEIRQAIGSITKGSLLYKLIGQYLYVKRKK